jgi:APA family basic amino acid/polyamine antiporter
LNKPKDISLQAICSTGLHHTAYRFFYFSFLNPTTTTLETAKQKIGLTGAIAVIAACMIGTGVFTSLGYQVYNGQFGIKSNFAIILLWATGGLVALCGARVYAELAQRIPGSGGEYNYLSNIYHPAVGFLSGWVSATIGFAAPIALSAMAFGVYFAKIVPGIYPMIPALIVVITAMIVNFRGLSLSETVQKSATYLNLALIIVLIFCGLFIAGNVDHFSFSIGLADWKDVFSSSFAISLVYVSYAFSGWNAVTYVAGDVKDPEKNVPKSLVWSVILVATLYIMLNFVFLYRVPMPELAGQVEVGAIAAKAIFGEVGEKLVSGLICLGLLASVLAMTIAGPRLTEKMGQDIKGLGFLTKKNKKGAPIVAIALQTSIAILLVLTDSFSAVLRYVGFTLALFTLLTVSGLFIVRFVKTQKFDSSFKGANITIVAAVIFIILELWMLYYMLTEKPQESIPGLITIFIGLTVYLTVRFEEMNGELKKLQTEVTDLRKEVEDKE